MPTPIAQGLKGIVAGESKITKVDWEKSALYFRGYNVRELIEYSSFEEVFWLLAHGELPKPINREWLSQELKRQRKITNGELRALLDNAFINQPMLALALFVAKRGVLRLPVQTTKELPQRATVLGTELCAAFPTVIANLIHWGCAPPRFRMDPTKNSYHIVQPHSDLSHAANFLWMLNAKLVTKKRPDDTPYELYEGEYPTSFEEKAMDTTLILHADHEFNASTYALRTAASTQADPFHCILVTLGALSGPKHGGANEMAMHIFEDIRKPERAAQWVVDRLINKQERAFGFGHRLYKKRDPRTQILKRLGKELCRRKHLPWYDIAREVEKTTLAILKQRGHEDLPANVDFYSPCVFSALGIPSQYMPLVFAMARIAGWTAHMKEQYEQNTLIRPLSAYMGPAPRPYSK